MKWHKKGGEKTLPKSYFFKSKIRHVTDSGFIARRQHEAFIFVFIFLVVFGYISWNMGMTNMTNTIMNTAFFLLKDVVLYLMGVMVLAGAMGRLMIEFGVIRLIETVLAPLMRPLFNLPGTAALAGLMSFVSDNPAIISLAHDKTYSRGFKQFELISLTNYGTAFGMGLVVITFMGGLTDSAGNSFWIPALIGLVGAIGGAIVSTRLMQKLIKNDLPEETAEEKEFRKEETDDNVSFKSRGPVFLRFINAVLDGGKSGVDLGLAIIPGVVIISTFIFLLTNGGPQELVDGEMVAVYTGAAKEGVALLPAIGKHFQWLFYGLFGFKDSSLLAFPITSLGSVGAALAIAKESVRNAIAGGNEIAVFTAMGMCWSGYLTTHTAMLDTLGFRRLTSKAFLSHTLGGLFAGVLAHWLFVLYDQFC
jgi:hypothetical protein